MQKLQLVKKKIYIYIYISIYKFMLTLINYRISTKLINTSRDIYFEGERAPKKRIFFVRNCPKSA